MVRSRAWKRARRRHDPSDGEGGRQLDAERERIRSGEDLLGGIVETIEGVAHGAEIGGTLGRELDRAMATLEEPRLQLGLQAGDVAADGALGDESSAEALVKLKCRAAASKARMEFSGGSRRAMSSTG